VRDTDTLEITRAVAARLAVLLGAAPYVVAARFLRTRIDANRPEAEALEHDEARPIYRTYHAHVRDFVAAINRRFPTGALLLDIHGQSAAPAAVLRGTRDGATVPRLLARHGDAALIGPSSVLGALAARGHAIVPPNTPPGAPAEPENYRGGFTVRTYGAEIDALQLELGGQVRAHPALIDDLAQAISVFARTYLAVAAP
jgi:N-formylglutamate amidohydrolase